MREIYALIQKALEFIYQLEDGNRVLMFHEVYIDEIISNRSYAIQISNFENIINDLKMMGEIVPITQIASDLNEKNSYCITFDDCYESVYQNAYPVLKRQSVPFTLFISVELLNKTGYLKTCQIAEMLESNLCNIGSHGYHHQFYRKLSQKNFSYEVIESKLQIERIFGKKVEYFAFPYGSLWACGILHHKNIILESYKNGFSTLKSPINKYASYFPEFLPRINVNDFNYRKLIPWL